MVQAVGILIQNSLAINLTGGNPNFCASVRSSPRKWLARGKS
jgi:hypothetical protein